jgi:hypothetical protein
MMQRETYQPPGIAAESREGSMGGICPQEARVSGLRLQGWREHSCILVPIIIIIIIIIIKAKKNMGVWCDVLRREMEHQLVTPARTSAGR